ncbi:hypothetical protein [Moorena sp. SIO2C4]|nr:hypothetical protein [Moorena sp. SIO2C4]NES43534.1 hypothetical protein [Moorena sp. SIO2C4]
MEHLYLSCEHNLLGKGKRQEARSAISLSATRTAISYQLSVISYHPTFDC